MLNAERLAALSAVKNGEVKARTIAATGYTTRYTPTEYIVALGFLTKAGLIETDLHLQTVSLTDRGARVLAANAP